MKLNHITDVGSPNGNGVDSTLRIAQQYAELGVDANVVSAGYSPLHVAFAGGTSLSKKASENAALTRELLGISLGKPLPVALNCAPRNSDKSQPDAAEDHIYRVRVETGSNVVLYGPEVLKWITLFKGRANVEVDRIKSFGDVIADTSRGSQFRSAEHLPLVHVAEAMGQLNALAVRESVDLQNGSDYTPKDERLVVLPPDEYGNGRVLVSRATFEEIFKSSNLALDSFNRNFSVAASLTDVVPGQLSVWPSSNYFPNQDLRVLNIGTRWSPGSTSTTDLQVIRLSEVLSKQVGTTYPFRLQ